MDYGPLLILPSLESEGMVSCIFPPELESQRFEPSKYQCQCSVSIEFGILESRYSEAFSDSLATLPMQREVFLTPNRPWSRN